MKIASHNVEFLFEEGKHVHSGQEWNYSDELVEARINHFASLFAQINADVLMLQEVASKSVLERIIERSGIDYFYFLATPDQNGVGNAILYKDKNVVTRSVPAVASLPIFVTDDVDVNGARIWSRRDFVHLETEFNNKELHLICIHIKSNFLMAEKDGNGKAKAMSTPIELADGLIRSELFRFSQAKKVREVIDDIIAKNADAQIIVGGDFNAEEDDSVFRTIRGVNNEAENALVTASQSVPQENRFSIASHGTKMLIDHLLLTKNLSTNLKDVAIFNEKLSDNINVAPDFTSITSDHAPIVVEV